MGLLLFWRIKAVVVCVGGRVTVYGDPAVAGHIRKTGEVPLTRNKFWRAFGAVDEEPLHEVGKARLKAFAQKPELYDLSVFGGQQGTGTWVVVYHAQ